MSICARSDVVECSYGILSVVFGDGGFELMDGNKFTDVLDSYTSEFTDIIGNIHDNPEPVGEQKNE